MSGATWTLAGEQLESRLLLGTGGLPHLALLPDLLAAARPAAVTVSVRRTSSSATGGLLPLLREHGVRVLPNTAGCRSAHEAVLTAGLAREALGTDWVKLEVIGDEASLLPDAVELLTAARELVGQGFTVLPYTTADPVLARRLVDVGCAAVMPLGAPIGSNRGLESRAFLEIIVAQSGVPVVIDAGLGSPSHAAEAMELGADAVLVNTAIAAAADPTAMGRAFKLGVEAGRLAYEAGLASTSAKPVAQATSPLTAFLTEAGA